MSEKSIVDNTPEPRTRAGLARDLRHLGVQPGMVLLLHSALSQLGWVNGGPVAVIQALQDVLTAEGTLVMPTHSGDCSDPAEWQNPPIPQSWHQQVRDTMPAFDPRLTPTRGMGRIAELFRTWPDVVRSYHPQMSFAAWGRHAQQITADHSLPFGMGENSPLARVYDLGGYVLLLGVGYANNTSFHLAEYRVPGIKRIQLGSPMLVNETLGNGRSEWTTYEDVDIDAEDFPQIGAAFEQTHSVQTGRVGSAECKLFLQVTAVDFAEQWMLQHRVRRNPRNN